METPAAIVGIRALWCCEFCDAREHTYQLVHADAFETIEAPVGWTRTKTGRVFCGHHRRAASQLREQLKRPTHG